MMYIAISHLSERILAFGIGVALIYFSYVKLRELFRNEEKDYWTGKCPNCSSGDIDQKTTIDFCKTILVMEK